MRTYPQDLEAEAAVLGSILHDPAVTGEVLELIPADRSDWFMGADYAAVYLAFVTLYRAGKPPNMIAYMDAAAGANGKPLVDEAMLETLVNAVSSAANAKYYAGVVRDMGRLRDAALAGRDIERLCCEGEGTADERIAAAQQRLIDGTASMESTGPVPMSEAVPGRIDEILHSSTPAGLTTGFSFLDDKLGGIRGGEMIVLAARPGVGKTSFGLAVLNHVATHLSRHTAFFSMEMSTRAIADRLISMVTGIDGRLLRTPRFLSRWQRERIEAAAGMVAWHRIHIDESSGLDSGEIVVRAMSLKRRYNIAFVLVDYLQLISNSDGRRENRQAEITRVSGAIKGLSKTLDVPILALAQLSREVEKRSGKPQLSDLRESGSIEQDADAVMFLYRKNPLDESKPPPAEEDIYLNIAKQRNGPLGRKLLVFTRATTLFQEIETKAAVDAAMTEVEYEPEVPVESEVDHGVPF